MTSPAGHYPGASLTVWSTSTPPGLLNRTRVSDGQQVGSGALPGFVNHALFWTGSADSVVDLHPSGFTDSGAVGVSAGQQVGWGSTVLHDHALLWMGSADSVVDLNPSGFTDSYAYAVSGDQQVGQGDTGGRPHAMLWTGSADSAVYLHPRGFTYSQAVGVSGGQQVGDGVCHALLRTGSADSVVDLHPRGFAESYAQGVSGGQQVGFGWGDITGSANHALLWTGSADSVVDLQTFLPPEFRDSVATGIDADANIVGYAQGPDGDHAFLLIPE